MLPEEAEAIKVTARAPLSLGRKGQNGYGIEYRRMAGQQVEVVGVIRSDPLLVRVKFKNYEPEQILAQTLLEISKEAFKKKFGVSLTGTH